MRNAGPDEAQAAIKIAGRNINDLRYADDTTLMGFPHGSVGKESACNAGVQFSSVQSLSCVRLFAGDLGSVPGLGISPGGGHDNPLQYSCLENLHGQRCLAGYSPLGCKQLDMTE